jgi:hypothetical protein
MAMKLTNARIFARMFQTNPTASDAPFAAASRAFPSVLKEKQI